ncbi:MAG TPA: SBBP repeat-containing protein [Candidatus Limnocylindrales bacterium]
MGRLLSMGRRGLALAIFALAAMVSVAVEQGDGRDERISDGQVAEAYAKLPLTFVENLGQADERVRYLTHGTRYGFFFTPDSLIMSLLRPDGAKGVNLWLDFVGASPQVKVDAADRAAGTVSYLKEASGGTHSGLPTFGEVLYRGLWPGVDMAVNGRDGILKYEFRVAPGTRVDDIRLAYRGAESLATDATGGLTVGTAIGALRDSAPVSYQLVGGERVPVESSYRLADANSYGFAVGGYNPEHELVIDPGLEYSTFLGGFGNQTGAAIAVDAAGNAYVTGFTQSPTFPTTPGAFDRTGSVGQDLDAFVSKLNPTGTALVYSTFLGGSNFEWGRDLAVDAAGSAYVTGQTKSSNFPTTSGAFDRTFNVDSCPRCGIDQYDAFVTKLNPSGSALVYSTFLGGFGIDDGMFLALDAANQVYLAGETASSNFPTTSGAFDGTANGGSDVYVAKFNAQGSQLLYSTRLGGADNELPGGIAVDASGNAVVGGSTRSIEFPSTPGTIQPVHSGGEFIELFEGFVTKLNPTGSALVYSTFLGGTMRDSIGEVFVDSLGNVYVGGGTFSPEFPTTPGVWDTVFDNGSEGFVVKLNPTASAFVYSTFTDGAGGSLSALNADGSVWLAGGGGPNSFVSPDAADPSFNGGPSDAYAARLNATATAFDYGTFHGGTGSEFASGIAVDPAGNIYLTGRTFSVDFPTTAGAIDRVYSGDSFILGSDAWVAKISLGPGGPLPSPTASASPSPPSSPPASPTASPSPSPPAGGQLPAPSLLSPGNDARFEPGTTITFDWSDVAGAASYTIQIDNNDNISSPFVAAATVTASQFTASGLPTQRMWWRVRAIDSNGNPGSWSPARRFELKD